MAVFPFLVVAWIVAVGLYGLVTSRDLIHQIVCLIVVQSSTYVLLLGVGPRLHVSHLSEPSSTPLTVRLGHTASPIHTRAFAKWFRSVPGNCRAGEWTISPASRPLHTGFGQVSLGDHGSCPSAPRAPCAQTRLLYVTCDSAAATPAPTRRKGARLRAKPATGHSDRGHGDRCGLWTAKRFAKRRPGE